MIARRLFLSPPHMGGEEQQLVNEAFESKYVAPVGPMVDAFEREFSEYVGIRHCLAVASGTAAMHLALCEAGVGPGDEVLASTLTFIGSVSPVTFLGGFPVFIDSDRETWTMDVDLLAEELAACARRASLPRAVVPTDLYGQCADFDRIKDVCGYYGIPVICDSAEAVGATYKGRHAGLGARASVYSFNGNKIITTSGGGMLASDCVDLIQHARFLSTQARDPVIHYEHSEIGYNYRMSNIVAAIGRGQLRMLAKRVEQKRTIFRRYAQLLVDVPGVTLMPEAPYGRCTRWLTIILINAEEYGTTPEEVRLALEAENIESRPVWKPMHLQPVFKGCRYRGGAVSEDLFRRGLCLSSGTEMNDSDVERVVNVILKVHWKREAVARIQSISSAGRFTSHPSR